jgi:hypothetical protein
MLPMLPIDPVVIVNDEEGNELMTAVGVTISRNL